MLAVGSPVPEVSVWRSPRERVELRELVEERGALFVFYLFDWSGT